MLLTDPPPAYLGDYFAFLRGVFPSYQEENIGVQVEHTLVLRGGRDSTAALPGKIMGPGGELYLVRVDELEQYDKCRLVLDYSIPNIFNVISCGRHPQLANKLLYAPPLFNALDTRGGRDIPCATLISGNYSPRRSAVVDEASKTIDGFTHLQDIYGAALYNALRSTRVLINVHQTDHHHTLEELRILPALLAGVIIVSEEVPCRHLVPYHQYVIWCNYSEITTTAKAIVADYNHYHNRLFGPNSHLPGILSSMEIAFTSRIRSARKNLQGNGHCRVGMAVDHDTSSRSVAN